MLDLSRNFNLFIVCPPHLEPLLEQELKGLGVKKYRQQIGGFELTCDFTMLVRLNLWLRVASRILVRFSRFRALHLDQLENPLGKLPWELFFTKGQSIPIHVTATHSRLMHTEAIAERAAAALCGLGYQATSTNSEEEKGVSLIYIRVFNDVVEVSINASGEHLYRRGYKKEIGPAPLRENLAAAMLMHLGYKGQRSLWDPCCGCGTIPIEAALIASRTAPGRFRTFACLDWPACPAALWEKEIARADELRKVPTFPIFASDISDKAITMLKNNAARAKVADFIQMSACAIEEMAAPPIGKGGLLLANPPYGERIQGVKGLRTIYYSFGNLLKNNPALQGAILVDSEELARLAGKGAVSSGLSFNHGGLPVTLYKL